MGLYFLTRGALLRPAEVTYDRAGSAFAAADPASTIGDPLLPGAAWLHVTGITQHSANEARRALLAAMDAAAHST